MSNRHNWSLLYIVCAWRIQSLKYRVRHCSPPVWSRRDWPFARARMCLLSSVTCDVLGKKDLPLLGSLRLERVVELGNIPCSQWIRTWIGYASPRCAGTTDSFSGEVQVGLKDGESPNWPLPDKPKIIYLIWLLLSMDRPLLKCMHACL